jgi:hypothetical protein
LDKIAKYEARGNRSHDLGNAAATAVDRLAALEGKLKLEITVERTPPAERETPQPPAIDVGKD